MFFAGSRFQIAAIPTLDKEHQRVTMATSISCYLSMMFMFQPSGAITIEPGKQLPHSLLVSVPADNGTQEQTIHYMLFTPRGYENGEKQWPLMLFLHGLGECGDNDLERVKIHGPAKLVETRSDFPFVVITPQCLPPKGGMKDVPTAWKPEPLIQLVDHIVTKMRIDPARVYVTGLSMGGYGTWRLAAKYPERFAAALPICGGGVPGEMAKKLHRLPIWAFHGARDPVVPLSASQEMVDAVERAGGDVRLTVYPDVAHDSWTPTYGNAEIYEWLLSHRRPMQ
jgi:predicted peptidase